MQEIDEPKPYLTAQILSTIGFLLFAFAALDSFGIFAPISNAEVDIKSRDIIAVTFGVVLFVMAMVALRNARNVEEDEFY